MWITPTTGGGAGAWLRRAAILIDVGGASPIDLDADLSDLPDFFWNDVLASGNDIRLTDSDGDTLITFEHQGLNTTTRVGLIEVDNQTVDASALNRHLVWWLYWKHTGTPVSASTVKAIAGPRPSSFQTYTQPTDYRHTFRPERLGTLNPRKRITKQAGETLHVWWNLGPSLQPASASHNGTLRDEEIAWIDFDITTGGASQLPGMSNLSQMRVVHPAIIRTEVKAGASGTDYTLELTVKTTHGRILTPRILLKVQDVDEQ